MRPILERKVIVEMLDGQKIRNIIKLNTKLKGEIDMFKKKQLTPSMMIQKAIGVVEIVVSMFNLAVMESDKNVSASS